MFNNTSLFSFFNFANWKSPLFFSYISLENITNAFKSKMIIFLFANNLNILEIYDIIIHASSDIQMINAFDNQIKMVNITISMNSLETYYLFEISSSSCLFENLTLIDIKNNDGNTLFLFEFSNINFNQLNFFFINGISLNFMILSLI